MIIDFLHARLSAGIKILFTAIQFLFDHSSKQECRKTGLVFFEIGVYDLVASADLKLWKIHVYVSLMSSVYITFFQFKVEPPSNNIVIL